MSFNMVFEKLSKIWSSHGKNIKKKEKKKEREGKKINKAKYEIYFMTYTLSFRLWIMGPYGSTHNDDQHGPKK